MDEKESMLKRKVPGVTPQECPPPHNPQKTIHSNFSASLWHHTLSSLAAPPCRKRWAVESVGSEEPCDSGWRCCKCTGMGQGLSFVNQMSKGGVREGMSACMCLRVFLLSVYQSPQFVLIWWKKPMKHCRAAKYFVCCHKVPDPNSWWTPAVWQGPNEA